MGDSSQIFFSSKKLEPKLTSNRVKQPTECVVASNSKGFYVKSLKCITSMKPQLLGSGGAGDIGLFIIKIAVLEIVRRYSRFKCPLIWRGLQAFQVLCYLPFKWIQTWAPFQALANFMQTLSRPLLVLTIATVFSDQSACTRKKLSSSRVSPACSELQQESSTELSTLDTRSCDEISKTVGIDTWLEKLYKELERQGINLPERLNADDLRRFYAAADGEFSRLLSSVKKTIHWRQTYTFLTPLELEAWSHLIFWHGHDAELRPCLIIRLGLACSNLGSNKSHLFAKAVVSQIEDAVIHLVDAKIPQITVLMDCDGLSPFAFPVQMMRSCAILLQDHYPNRLGYFIIVRLPPVARMITQTIFQVMRPATQQKIRIVGDQKVLEEFLQTLPSFLGGKCPCLKCCDLVGMVHHTNKELISMKLGRHLNNDNSPSLTLPHSETRLNQNSDPIVRIAVIGVLIIWIFVALVLARHYPDCLSVLFRLDGS